MSAADDMAELVVHVGADGYELRPACQLCGGMRASLYWDNLAPTVGIHVHTADCPLHPTTPDDEQARQLERLSERVEVAHLEQVYSLPDRRAPDGP
jgi:hypothetical protein